METILYEVDIENFSLKTKSGEVYRVNVYDMTICCCWLPTSPIRIFEDCGQVYCKNLSLNSMVRLV